MTFFCGSYRRYLRNVFFCPCNGSQWAPKQFVYQDSLKYLLLCLQKVYLGE